MTLNLLELDKNDFRSKFLPILDKLNNKSTGNFYINEILLFYGL